MNKYLEKIASNWGKIEDRIAKRFHSQQAAPVTSETGEINRKMREKHPWLVPARISGQAKDKAENAAAEAKSFSEARKDHTLMQPTESMKGNDIVQARFKKELSSRLANDQVTLDTRADKLSRAHYKLDEITEKWRAGVLPNKKSGRNLKVVK